MLIFNGGLAIGYNSILNLNNNNYKININGSIYSTNNINAINNIQENGINLKDKYLTIQDASTIYLSLNGGVINNLTVNNSLNTNNLTVANSLNTNNINNKSFNNYNNN